MKSYPVNGATAGETLVAYPNPRTLAPIFCSLEESDALAARLMKLDGSDLNVQRLRRLIMGYAIEIVVGDDGMAQLPDYFADLGEQSRPDSSDDE